MNKLISRISLNIKGKNINRFIKKLRSSNIDILNIKYVNKNEANIVIYRKDYEKLLKIKSIYDVSEIEVFGMIKIKRSINKNKYLIIMIIICFIIFKILTFMIFDIEVIHSNRDIRSLIRKELRINGIRKYSFKKSYFELSKIKENILNKHTDKIEWLEIENNGTKIIVKVEERKINKKEEDNTPRNIVAKKPGIIKKVIAKKGDIVKDMDDYVEKGELIITGDLIFNNELKGQVKADGKVYAEIWYVTKTEYPLAIDSDIFSGRKKNVYALKFLNRTFEFVLDKFKYKKIKETDILKNNILPIKLVRQSQSEIKKVSKILTYEEALEKAKSLSIAEIKGKLKDDEYIIRNAYLKSREKNSTIELEMFFSVYEDITDYKKIGE